MKKIGLLVLVLLFVALAGFAGPSKGSFIAVRSHHTHYLGGRSNEASQKGLQTAAAKPQGVQIAIQQTPGESTVVVVSPAAGGATK